MKKVTPKTAATSGRSTVAKGVGAAALVMLPLTMITTRAEAQTKNASSATPIKKASPSVSLNFAKVEIEYSVLGVGDGGKAFFKGADGRTFTVDPASGDLRFVSDAEYIKMSSSDLKGSKTPFIKWKSSERVHILGVDARGNVVLARANGEKFYLSANGDMVPTK